MTSSETHVIDVTEEMVALIATLTDELPENTVVKFLAQAKVGGAFIWRNP